MSFRQWTGAPSPAKKGATPLEETVMSKTTLFVGALALAAAAQPAGAASEFCSSTARLLYEACQDEAEVDAQVAKAVCINESNSRRRADCLDDAKQAKSEARAECREQRDARIDICDALGEERYDPSFDPDDFDRNFVHPAHPNPWFPLRVGNRWSYAGGGEKIEVEVLDETKEIEGVTCVVVRDRVEEDGDVIEDTDDWFGQRKNGTVDYCGEISQSFELFEGDDPEVPELVSLEGSWKTGVDGARNGTIFPAQPLVGAVYRQEFAPGTAEDVAEVLSTTYAFGRDARLDAHVPRALARLLCSAADCVVTAETNPFDPDVLERKYYARGIGLFLEVDVESGDTVRLVDCSFDARCDALR
jgi:hypothetical protein